MSSTIPKISPSLHCPSLISILSLFSVPRLSSHCTLDDTFHFHVLSTYPSSILSIFSLNPFLDLICCNLEFVFHPHFTALLNLLLMDLLYLSGLLITDCLYAIDLFNNSGNSLISSIPLHSCLRFSSYFSDLFFLLLRLSVLH